MTDQPPPPYWAPPPTPKRKIGTVLILAVVGALVVAGAAVGITLAVTQYDGKSPVAMRPVPLRSSSSAAPSSTRRVPQNIETKVGETTGFTSPGSTDTEIEFAITKITVDGRCTEQFAEKAENGHYIFLNLTIETAPTMGRTFAPGLLNPQYFSIVGPDGITETGLATVRTFGCLARGKQLPASLSPGQKYLGTIVLDSRYTSGSLILSAAGGMIDADGWKWTLGQV